MGSMAGMADASKQQRLISGWLDHVLDNKIATRWAVLEQSVDQESVTLRLFRSDKEACEKQTYKLGKENFIGTERGSVQQHNKKTPALYWAIITVHDQTLLFQDNRNSDKSVSTFEKWDKILKDFWNHQSWLIKPQQGPNSFIKERGLTLHINRASVSFAYLNPPKLYCRLYLDTIEWVSYNGTRLSFSVATGNSGDSYYEVKTERERFAVKIKEIIESLRSRYLGIAFPEQAKSPPNVLHLCTSDGQKASLEGQSCASLHSCKSPNPNSNSNPLQNKVCSISPIDETTGEDIHMDIGSLALNFHSCRTACDGMQKCPTSGGVSLQCKSPEPEAACVPSIRVMPISTGVRECKQESECVQRKCPDVPPRTTSCTNGPGLAAKSAQTWADSQASTGKLQNMQNLGMSASTGKLHAVKLDQTSWELPSPTLGRAPKPAPRRLKPESSDGTRVISAVKLPLPELPVEKPNLAKHAVQDDYDSIGDSMSSITSQNSDVTSMDMTQSLSSLSSEEERCRSSSTESRMKRPVRTSASSLNACPSPSMEGTSKNPGYFRSVSVPTELPQNHRFSESNHTEPEYESTDQDYINLSKESLMSPDIRTTDGGDALYINMAHEQSLYVNPPLVPSVNPIPVPPRHPQPPPTQPKPSRPECSSGNASKNAVELHEVLDAMLKGDELGGTMGLPNSVLVKFRLNCDVERGAYSTKNWRGLAEQLGLSSTDILLVDDCSRRYKMSPTQLILAYWEKQAHPVRPFSMAELISMLHELERQDLLDIVIQRERYTGSGVS